MKKTLKGWRKFGGDLDKYLTEPCFIDEKLYMYLAEAQPPNFSDGNGIVQVGETHHEKNGILFYDTIEYCGNGKYKYLGCLPDMDIE